VKFEFPEKQRGQDWQVDAEESQKQNQIPINDVEFEKK
jgi:hypothetical protein